MSSRNGRGSREVHDVLAHSLGALGIQLQTVRALFTVHNDPDRALEALARATTELAGRHRVQVHYQASGTPLSLPPEATVALLRIAQESMVNAVKHAPGAEIAVDLNYQDDGVRLTVTNPLTPGGPGATGSGADALRTLDTGYGLTGMRERLLLLRGNLEAGQRDGQWAVVADLPLTPTPVIEKADR